MGLAVRDGPAAVEFAWFLALGTFAGITLDDVLKEAAASMGERHDAAALEMALLATFAAFGWKMALEAAVTRDVARRATAQETLISWTDRIRRALEVWSPI